MNVRLRYAGIARLCPVPLLNKTTVKPMKKPAYAVEGAKPEDAPEAEAEDALVVDSEDEATTAGDEDETFLEEEEEGGSDMSNIIGGPVAEPEEPQ